MKIRKAHLAAAVCLSMQLCMAGCGVRSGEIVWEQTESERTGETVSGESAADTENTGESAAETGTAGSADASIPEGEIYVDICGAVAHPGVYRLPEGARLYQAVELAGGLTEDADLTALNQASVLSDGMKILVYTREETLALKETGGTASSAGAGAFSDSASASDSVSDGKVNLNTADKETLKSLTGIGDVKAQLIIDWRTEHGGFSSIEELMQISGIKEGTFNKIKDKIVVE